MSKVYVVYIENYDDRVHVIDSVFDDKEKRDVRIEELQKSYKYTRVDYDRYILNENNGRITW